MGSRHGSIALHRVTGWHTQKSIAGRAAFTTMAHATAAFAQEHLCSCQRQDLCVRCLMREPTCLHIGSFRLRVYINSRQVFGVYDNPVGEEGHSHNLMTSAVGRSPQGVVCSEPQRLHNIVHICKQKQRAVRSKACGCTAHTCPLIGTSMVTGPGFAPKCHTLALHLAYSQTLQKFCSLRYSRCL